MNYKELRVEYIFIYFIHFTKTAMSLDITGMEWDKFIIFTKLFTVMCDKIYGDTR